MYCDFGKSSCLQSKPVWCFITKEQNKEKKKKKKKKKKEKREREKGEQGLILGIQVLAELSAAVENSLVQFFFYMIFA